MRARDNPFTVQRVHALAFRMEEEERVRLWDRWQELGRRGALVGPHGHGKSTLLAELRAQLEEEGWGVRSLTLRQGQRRFSVEQRWELEDLASRDVVLLDGAEQLGWWSRRRFLRAVRSAGGLLVTTHREGFLPTVYHCRTSPDLLADLVGELHPEPGCRQPGAGELHRRHRGNVRLALRELYDLHARDQVGCPVTTRPVDSPS